MLQLTNHVIVSSIDRRETYFSFLPLEIVNELDCYRGDALEDYAIGEIFTADTIMRNKLWILCIYQRETKPWKSGRKRVLYETRWKELDRLFFDLTEEEYPTYLELLNCVLHRKQTPIKCIADKHNTDRYIEYRQSDDCFIYHRSGYNNVIEISIPHELLVEMYKVTPLKDVKSIL